MSNSLNAGQSLLSGSSIRSSNGRFSLNYQGDGNLVIYDDGGTAIWASNTAGSVGGECIMKGDGNLVIQTAIAGSAFQQTFWSSGTSGNSGNRLVLEDDGNLVIYRPNN